MNRTRTQFPASGRPVPTVRRYPTVRRRYALWLRPLSLLLALCCFWSFAASGIALAAVPDHGKTMGRLVSHPFPHAPAFQAPPSPFALPPAALHSAPAWRLTQAPSDARAKTAAPSETLLDEVGHLAQVVRPAQALAWKRELARHPSLRRAALLHVWLGEWQMAVNEQPRTAEVHFQQAQALVPKSDRLRGLAAYDEALALVYQSAFQPAADRFRALIGPKAVLGGYNRSYAALWERHAAACAGYHAQHAAAGIPEPPALDPLCAAAALAASLRSLGHPFDKKTVLSACRVTGRGSNLQDILTAAGRLHVSAVAVSADDEGLRRLPKPLTAYVEHDHYVSVVRADNRGVSYLCSDCGMWPGGRVDLTWAQWHLMETTFYVAVTEPGDPADLALKDALAPAPPAQTPPVRVGFTGKLSDLSGAFRLHTPASSLLRGHIVRTTGGKVGLCGLTVSSVHSCKENAPKDGPGKGPGKGKGNGPSTGPIKALLAGGPGDGDPVNLATGEEEYTPPSDLVVYNPHGPSVDWGRIYYSLRSADTDYQNDDLGSGWSQPYNVLVNDPTVATPASNPQAKVATSTAFSATGSEAAGAGLTWDVVRGGVTVATSAATNGWSVGFASSSPYGGSSGTFTLTPPASTTVATGYKVRYLSPITYPYNQTAYASAVFDVVSGYSVPQGDAAPVPAPGTDAPVGGYGAWDVLLNGTTIATSAQPHAWQMSFNGSATQPAFTVQAPLGATIGGGYEIRYNGYSQGIHSGFFSVGSSQFLPGTGSGNLKYLIEPNGARIQFTAGTVPTAAQPRVQCQVETGVAMLVEWDYDAASSAGHYTLTMPDRTKWVTSAPSREVASGSSLPYSYSLYYSLSQIVDRNGNALNLTYGYTNPGDNWPLLTGIADAATGTTLLSLNRDTNGFLTSVSDAYGRSVVYGKDGGSGRLGQVSQIIPTAALSQSGLPVRYTYGYYTISSHDGYTDTRLHTIATPSPAGGGATSTATINYGQDGYVSSLVDGNGNTRTYNYYLGRNGYPSASAGNLTQTIVSNASGTTYSYTVSYAGNMNEMAETDGRGMTILRYVYASAADPYRPTSVYDGNGASQIPRGGSATLPTTGGDHPAAGGSSGWDVVNPAGTVIATNSAAAGWTVTYNGTTSTLTISAPSGTALGAGYEARIYDGNYDASVSTYFSVVASGTSGTPPTQYTWDQYGNLLTEISPRGTTTTYTPNYTNFALGELTEVQEGSKSPTVYAYDDTDGYTDGQGFHPSGLISSVTAPLPGTVGSTQTVVTAYTYDITGRGQQPLGQLGLGNVLTVSTPGNNAAATITTTYGYTTDGTYHQSAAMGQPLTVTDNLGKVTHLRYDAQGNTTAVKDALGNETDLTYDIRNASLQTILPATGQTGSGHGGSQTGYLYAEPSAFATAQWPAITLQYGPAATATVYDEGNVGAIRQVTSIYGGEGELKSVSGSTEPVAYTYDALYRLSTLTDAASHVTSYFYNAAGYTAQVVYPGAQATPPTAPLAAGHADTTTLASYDADGNLLSRVDGRSQTTTYTYNDPESRLTQITYPASTIGNVTLSYDAYGRLGNTVAGQPGLTDGTGSQTYAYDDDNDLKTKTVTWTGVTGSKSVSYGFYNNGSRSSLNAAGRVFSYAYDGVGRLAGLTNDNSEATSWTYLDNGWLKGKTLANGVATTDTLDQLGRLRDLVNKNSGSTSLSDFAVPATGGYDGVGNRLSVTATLNTSYAPASYSGTTGYTYDYGSTTALARRSQMTQETSTRGGGYTNAFGYDGGTTGGPGNPTSFKGVTNTFNADNQVTNTGYGYDGNGNPTTYKASALTFDPENRLTAYGTAQTDGYSGDGLRAWKQSSAGKTCFLYDGSRPIAEYNSTGTLTATNTFGVDGLVSRRSISSSTTTFYTFDERGNVVQRLSSTGAVQNTDLYDSYGSRTGTAGQPDPFGFEGRSGYYMDAETGLLLCTHRFYDPSTGRFVTRDPIGYGGGVNLYGYTGNDPGNRRDPSGFDGVGDPGGITGSGTAGFQVGGTASGFGMGGGFSVGIATDTQGDVGVTWEAYGGGAGSKNPEGGLEFTPEGSPEATLTWSNGNLTEDGDNGNPFYYNPATPIQAVAGGVGPVVAGVVKGKNEPPTFECGVRIPGNPSLAVSGGYEGGVGINGSTASNWFSNGINEWMNSPSGPTLPDGE